MATKKQFNKVAKLIDQVIDKLDEKGFDANLLSPTKIDIENTNGLADGNTMFGWQWVELHNVLNTLGLDYTIIALENGYLTLEIITKEQAYDGY